MEQTDYLIIGGGLTGQAAVEAIRAQDKNNRLVLVSNEPHLPYDRVPLSKQYLTGKMKRDLVFLQRQEYYASERVEVITGHGATALNTGRRIVQLDDGREIGFKKMLLATGGRVRKLSLPGSDLSGVFYLRTLDDSDSIKAALAGSRRAVIVGGGFIGCEVAAACSVMGLETTIIEIGPSLLSLAIDEGTAGFVTNFFIGKGVRVLAGKTAARFVGEGGKLKALETSDGETVSCDFAVVGVGIAPNTELASQAGLKVDNGIVVNEYLETEVEGIFAAGDVARFHSPLLDRSLRVEHYDLAVKHGGVAGANMAGEKKAFTEPPYFFSFQFNLNIQVVGEMSQRDRVVRRGLLEVPPGFVQFYVHGSRLDAVLLMNRPARELSEAKNLIARRPRSVDEARLADESIPLGQI